MVTRIALLVVALTLLLPAAPAWAAGPSVTYRLDGEELTACVVGTPRTGVWRVRLVAPSGMRRIDFVLRTGDIAWAGLIRVASRESGSWIVTRTISLDRALAGRTRLLGCNAGVCWDTALLRLPRNGDRKFGLTVRLALDGRYLLSGGVRIAREAFIYGRWLNAAPVPVRV